MEQVKQLKDEKNKLKNQFGTLEKQLQLLNLEFETSKQQVQQLQDEKTDITKDCLRLRDSLQMMIEERTSCEFELQKQCHELSPAMLHENKPTTTC